jgi:hypothetical protein
VKIKNKMKQKKEIEKGTRLNGLGSVENPSGGASLWALEDCV